MTSGEAFRAVWLSDVHLGSRSCRIDLLLDFLRHLHCDHLYLVGDIIDLESMQRSFYWPSSHTQALQVMLKKSKNGMRITYIPGNHDDALRALVGAKFGNIEIARRCVHATRAGRRFLVLHGDEFDTVIKCGPLARRLGSVAYRTLLGANRTVHWVHEVFHWPYWSLAQHVKNRMAGARRYVVEFRRAALHAAKEAGMDGVICGHIHRADLARHEGLLYCNDGDWVESCTALVEDQRGELVLIDWRRQPAFVPLDIVVSDAA